MRKLIVKRLAALAVALLMTAMVPVCALAEGEDITTPTDLAPVASETAAEGENASNVTGTAEDAAPVVTEEQPAGEPTIEPTEEPTESRLPEPAAEPTAEPVPQGDVKIVLRTEGPLYYGDEVTLYAQVDGVEGNYSLTWQVKVDIDEWESVGEGVTYKFILTPENASLEYRVVLNVIE